jgi:hypothetical protein
MDADEFQEPPVLELLECSDVDFALLLRDLARVECSDWILRWRVGRGALPERASGKEFVGFLEDRDRDPERRLTMRLNMLLPRSSE